MPAPGGTYQIGPSVGKQLLSRYASAPQAGLGTSNANPNPNHLEREP
jgi:hypothetical protein